MNMTAEVDSYGQLKKKDDNFTNICRILYGQIQEQGTSIIITNQKINCINIWTFKQLL